MTKKWNCWVSGVRCVNLLDHYPYCDVHPKTKTSQPSVTAVKDSSICGDYDAIAVGSD